MRYSTYSGIVSGNFTIGIKSGLSDKVSGNDEVITVCTKPTIMNGQY